MNKLTKKKKKKTHALISWKGE